MDPLVKRLDSYMAEFQKGNLDSFASFYELTHRKIYYISYGLLGQKEDAEDVCQMTYAQCIEKIASYVLGTNPLSFLATIARNYCYTLLRGRADALEYEDGLHETGASYDQYGDEDGMARLLSPLSEAEREIVILHVLDELKFAEIAKITGKKLSSVLVAYHRAIKKMKRKEDNRL